LILQLPFGLSNKFADFIQAQSDTAAQHQYAEKRLKEQPEFDCHNDGCCPKRDNDYCHSKHGSKNNLRKYSQVRSLLCWILFIVTASHKAPREKRIGEPYGSDLYKKHPKNEFTHSLSALLPNGHDEIVNTEGGPSVSTKFCASRQKA